jgi:kynurenine 3-monooxygenase
MKKVTIIGAGLAGSLLSIYLAKKGFEVQIFEQRPDLRVAKISAGRSINLALSLRGIIPLQEVGLSEHILKIAIPMYGRMMHDLEGNLSFQPYGKSKDYYINSVSRKTLNCSLMNYAEATGKVKIYFMHRCTNVDLDNQIVTIKDEQNGTEFQVQCEIIIGTDGAPSAVRNALIKLPRFSYSQEYLDYGYKELNLYPNAQGEFQLEKNALHIWPRGNFMLIALANVDKTFTCTLFHPYESTENLKGLEDLNHTTEIEKFFNQYFKDIVPLMPDFVEQFQEHPTGHLATIRCHPWHYKNTCILGDASHAVVPFFGQGMNCSFEDCAELNRCIDLYPNDWNQIFKEFEKRRIENANAIADLALENFIEMREKVADPKFLFRKKVDIELEKRFEGRYITKYGMVTFHTMPYAQAKRLGQIQDIILDELCRNAQTMEDIRWDLAESLIEEYLG